jgi:hypothetical protein
MTAPAGDLENEIAHLRDLDLSGLRARWRSAFRRKAPDHLPRHLLYRIIAYRLQAERLGDLDQEIQRFLDRMAPRGIGLAQLIDAPAEWDQQHRMLGLAS